MAQLEHTMSPVSSVSNNDSAAMNSPSANTSLDGGNSVVSAAKLEGAAGPEVNGKVDVHSLHSHYSQHRHSLTEASNLKNDNEQRNHQNEQAHSEGDTGDNANFQANLADDSAFELKLFVGQIPPDVSLDSLRALFENYGEVSNIYVLRDKITSRSRGCAFISYKNKNSADAAIAALHDRFKLPNAKRELIVKYADSQQPYSANQTTPNGAHAQANAGGAAFDQRRRMTVEWRGSTSKGKFRNEFGHHPNSSSTSQLNFLPGQQQSNTAGNGNGNGFNQSGHGFYGGYSEGDGNEHAFNTINSNSPSSSFHNASDDSQASGGPDTKDDEFKLYVSHLSRTTTENDVRLLFANYGDVREVFFLRDLKQSGQPFKGIAFVKMSSYQSAQRAIDALNHQYHDQGMTTPINVRFAFSKEAKTAFQSQKQHQQAWLAMQQQYTAMQPYAAIYTGMHAAAAGFPHAAAIGALTPASFQQFAANASNANPNSATTGVAALNGSLANLHLNASGHTGASPHGGSGHPFSAILPSNTVAGKDSKGPEGANLFVYGLPEQVNDNELLAMFTPFGHLVSARVHRDLTTGLSRGFGFVSYDQPHSAQQAIAGMDGVMYGNKKLTVRLKKGEEYGTNPAQPQTQHTNQTNATAHSVLSHTHGHPHTQHTQHHPTSHSVHAHSLQQQHVHALSQLQAAAAANAQPANAHAAAAALAHHPLSLAASINQSGVNAVNAAAASHAQQVLHSHLQAQAAQVQAAAVQQAQAAQAAQAHALAQAQAHSNQSFALTMHQPHSPTAGFQPFKY